MEHALRARSLKFILSALPTHRLNDAGKKSTGFSVQGPGESLPVRADSTKLDEPILIRSIKAAL